MGVMLNMQGLQWFGGNMDGAHSHLMRGREIARVIFKHCGRARGQPVNGENRLKGGAFGFWAKACVFNPIDRIKKPGQSARLQHPMGVGFAGIGIDLSLIHI